MDEAALLLKGFLMGLSIAAPVGPIGLLCIRRSLSEGRQAGLVTGLGAACADAVYGSVVAFGLTWLSGFLIARAEQLRLVGSLFLLYLAVRIFFALPAERHINAQAAPGSGMFLSTFFLTLSNPATILSFLAVFTSLGVVQVSRSGGSLSGLWLVVGVFSGSALWWLILSSLADVFGRRLGSGGLRWVNRASGLLIGAFALVGLLGG